MSWVLIVLAIVLPLGAAVLFPDQTERVYNWMVMFKRYIIGPVSLLFGALFILTFDPTLVVIGMLIFAYSVWQIAFQSDIDVI